MPLVLKSIRPPPLDKMRTADGRPYILHEKASHGNPPGRFLFVLMRFCSPRSLLRGVPFHFIYTAEMNSAYIKVFALRKPWTPDSRRRGRSPAARLPMFLCGFFFSSFHFSRLAVEQVVRRVTGFAEQLPACSGCHMNSSRRFDCVFLFWLNRANLSLENFNTQFCRLRI